MKPTAGLAALAVITVAGFAPATALSPQRALASAARASASATGPGSTRVSENFTTIAYRTDTGQTAWLARYKGPRNFAAATSLAVSPTGQGVFVTGSIGVHDGCCNFGTVAYQP